MARRAISLSPRYAVLSMLTLVWALYQFLRTSAVVAGHHLRWVPETTQPELYRIGFHIILGFPAAVLCAVWACQAIASMQMYITPHITATKARQIVAGSWFTRHLPSAPVGSFTIQFSRLNDTRIWASGIGLFLVTSLPYWLLLALFGHIVALGPLYLVGWIGHELPRWLSLGLLAAGLALLVIRRRFGRHRQRRASGADGPALAILTFMAGSEDWSSRQRWQASALYSLWLQKRGFFPLLTLFTAVPSQRLMLEIYTRRVKTGHTSEQAMSYILSLRTTRLIIAALVYLTIIFIRLWPHIWSAAI